MLVWLGGFIQSQIRKVRLLDVVDSKQTLCGTPPKSQALPRAAPVPIPNPMKREKYRSKSVAVASSTASRMMWTRSTRRSHRPSSSRWSGACALRSRWCWSAPSCRRSWSSSSRSCGGSTSSASSSGTPHVRATSVHSLANAFLVKERTHAEDLLLVWLSKLLLVNG